MARPNTNNNAEQTVTRSSSELSPQDFIKMLDETVGTKKHLAPFMPEFFWQQATAGCSHFIIPTEMIQDRLLNIVLEQAIQVNESTVSIKFRLSAKMDKTFNFVQLSKNNQNVDAGWLAGFRSLSIDLGEDVVDKGYLTSEEIGYLKTHAEFYQRVGNEAYSKDKEYTRIRPYLSNVEGKSGEFLFLCDVRLRPLNNDEKVQIAAGNAVEDDFLAARESIGIILKGWTPGAFRLIGRVSETVSIDSRSGGTLEDPIKAVRGNWYYKRP